MTCKSPLNRSIDRGRSIITLFPETLSRASEQFATDPLVPINHVGRPGATRFKRETDYRELFIFEG